MLLLAPKTLYAALKVGAAQSRHIRGVVIAAFIVLHQLARTAHRRSSSNEYNGLLPGV